jgi:transcriptional regulator with XRE-family HTH domain
LAGDDVSGLEERLKQARKNARLSQKELSELLDISDKSILRYEKDASTITVSMVTKISHLCGVNELWLLTGVGDMVNGIEESTGNLQAKSSDQELSHSGLVNYFEDKDIALKINWNLIKLEKADPKAMLEIYEYTKMKMKINGINEENQKKTNDPLTWSGEDRRKNKAS